MRKTLYFWVAMLVCMGMFLTDSSSIGRLPSARGDEPIAEVGRGAAAEAAELDVAKGRIEGRLKNVLALQEAADLLAEQAAVKEAPRPPADRGKALLEQGAKRLVLLSADEAATKLAAARPAAEHASGRPVPTRAAEERAQEKPYSEERMVASDSANPQVEPGKVIWHTDFAAACKASRHSGKPVLLFQLLGQLDQRFT
jgi:hypothetical protein